MTEYLSPTSEVLVQCAVKSTVILAVAGLLSVTLFRRASAATRHLVWSMAFVAVLMLPVLSLRLPAWHVLPAWAGPQAASVPTSPKRSVSTSVAQAAAAPQGQSPVPTRVTPVNTSISSPPAATTAASPLPAATIPPEVSEAPRRFGSIDIMAILLTFWAVGAVVAALPTVLAPLLLWRLRRRAVPLREASWTGLLAELRGQLRVRRRVALLQGRTTVPASFGILSPTILVPAGGEKGSPEGHPGSKVWPAERRRIVLLHELAHIKRHDHLTLLVSQIACAVYWFNPLVWVAARRLHVERERACDDLVLGAGVEAPAYARMLLRIVQGFTKAAAPRAALHMATPSTLEQRVRAILMPGQNRRRMPFVSAALFVALSAGVLIPLSMVRAGQEGAEWRELARRLGSADYATREGAQKELEKIPAEQFAALKAFAQAQADPEVKARLDLRLSEMEAYPLLHLPPLTVHLKNADIDTVVNTLNEQLGGRLILTPEQAKYFAGTTPAGPNRDDPPEMSSSARFTLDCQEQPFWEIIRQLVSQQPVQVSTFRASQLYFFNPGLLRPSSLGRLQGAFRPVDPKYYQSCDGFLLIPYIENDPNVLRAQLFSQNIAMSQQRSPGAGRRQLADIPEKLDPQLVRLNISLIPDPRVKIHQFSPNLHITEMRDDRGNNLLSGLLPSEDALFSLPFDPEAQHPIISANLKMPPQHGSVIISLKGTIHMVLAAEESVVTIDNVEASSVKSVPLKGATYIFEGVNKIEPPAPPSPAATRFLTQVSLNNRLVSDVDPSPLIHADLIDSEGRIVLTHTMMAGRTGGSSGKVDSAGPLKLRVRQALRTLEVDIPFELKNIPLP